MQQRKVAYSRIISITEKNYYKDFFIRNVECPGMPMKDKFPIKEPEGKALKYIFMEGR